ncbi:MAG: sensor domain-containing diguanylate cyclase [Desulfuromonadaceae bacterium]|nr:sensor domain-containing diguanylate cyclase [Desulfuromonadaceae bacterium]
MTTHDETVDLATRINDLTEELENREAELARYKELFQVLADWSTNWIFWESPDGEILYVSPAACRISGYSPEELKRKGNHFHSLVHPEDRDVWQKHHREAIQRNKTPPLDIRILTKSGETRWLSHSCQTVLAENGNLLGLRGSLADITERKQIEEQLRFLSSRDSLTGLYSRGFFKDALDRHIKGRIFPVTLMIADLDRLKEVNDTLGHGTGDQLLRQAARLFQKIFRTEDVVARIGGDEFAVLLPGVNEAMAIQILQRFRRLEAEHNGKLKDFKVAFSIGVFTAVDGKSLATAMEKADAGMYRDKKRRKAEGKEEMNLNDAITS